MIRAAVVVEYASGGELTEPISKLSQTFKKRNTINPHDLRLIECDVTVDKDTGILGKNDPKTYTYNLGFGEVLSVRVEHNRLLFNGDSAHVAWALECIGVPPKSFREFTKACLDSLIERSRRLNVT